MTQSHGHVQWILNVKPSGTAHRMGLDSSVIALFERKMRIGKCVDFIMVSFNW